MNNILGDALRVSLGDLFYFKRNFATIMITILVTPLLYYLSFCYGLGSSVSTTEGVSYVAFVIPGVMALSTLTSCFNSIANKVLVQRVYYSSFDEVILCPIAPSAVILGKALIGFIRGMIGCMILLLIGYIMSPDMHVNALLILCIALSCLVFSLFGVLAGFISSGLNVVSLITGVVVVPMTFLCGTVFSVSSMPTAIQYLISVMPLTHSVSCIRSAALGWEFPIVSASVLILFGILFFAISYYVLIKGKT